MNKQKGFIMVTALLALSLLSTYLMFYVSQLNFTKSKQNAFASVYVVDSVLKGLAIYTYDRCVPSPFATIPLPTVDLLRNEGFYVTNNDYWKDNVDIRVTNISRPSFTTDYNTGFTHASGTTQLGIQLTMGSQEEYDVMMTKLFQMPVVVTENPAIPLTIDIETDLGSYLDPTFKQTNTLLTEARHCFL